MNTRIKCILFFALLFPICLANKAKLLFTGNRYIDYFLHCYFNDVVGTVCFFLILSLLLSFKEGKRVVFKLYHIEIIIIASGLFWEFITPLYRKDCTTDPFDIGAYVAGSLIFWYIFNGKSLINHISTNADNDAQPPLQRTDDVHGNQDAV